MSDGFLGRWSRRKLDAREGRPLPAEPPAPAADEPTHVPQVPTAVADPAPKVAVAPSDVESPAPDGAADEPPPPPPPTMEDVQALTSQSDFSRFAARDVAADVKNAALKKLFADPRYNVMDGLDVYIDDYTRPDPLPARTMRQLAGAAFLGLFDAPPAEAPAASRTRDVADNPAGESVAQSDTVSDAAVQPPTDADTDLRLQQDDALATRGPGQGAA